MPLCGASRFCGCNIVSAPAISGEIDGELPSIEVSGDGYGASPWNLILNDGWTTAVANLVTQAQPWLDGFGEEGTYTPTLTNMAIGAGGSPSNAGRYRFYGGPETGDEGLLYLEGDIVLGTSGSVSGSISVTVPSGFQMTSTHRPRLFTGRSTAGGGNYIVHISPISSDTLQINALRANATYLDTVGTSATIPGTWAAGNQLTWGGIWPAVRV